MLTKPTLTTTEQTQLARSLPFGRHEFVDVEFPPIADTDIIVYPSFLSMQNGSNWRWIDIKSSIVGHSSGFYRDGVWNSVTYDSGNFGGNGSMTLGVDSGDITNNSFMLIGDTMWWNIRFGSATIGGTPNTELRLTIPGGFTAAQTTSVTPGYVNENGTIIDALAETVSGQTYVAVTKKGGANWAANTNNTYIYLLMPIIVSTQTRISHVPQIYASPATKHGTDYLMLRSTVGGYKTRLLLFEERN